MRRRPATTPSDHLGQRELSRHPEPRNVRLLHSSDERGRGSAGARRRRQVQDRGARRRRRDGRGLPRAPHRPRHRRSRSRSCARTSRRTRCSRSASIARRRPRAASTIRTRCASSTSASSPTASSTSRWSTSTVAISSRCSATSGRSRRAHRRHPRADARAVAVAHELGIVHRDLKPENIMVSVGADDDGAQPYHVKVCDFGIAKLNDPRGFQTDGGQGAHLERHAHRYARVHVAGASARRPARRALGHLLGGHHPLSAARRAGAVHRRERARRRAEAGHRRARVSVAGASRREPATRGHLPARAEEDSRRALPDREGDAPRSPQRARLPPPNGRRTRAARGCPRRAPNGPDASSAVTLVQAADAEAVHGGRPQQARHGGRRSGGHAERRRATPTSLRSRRRTARSSPDRTPAQRHVGAIVAVGAARAR